MLRFYTQKTDNMVEGKNWALLLHATVRTNVIVSCILGTNKKSDDIFVVDLSVLLSYYVAAVVVRCAQVLYTENRQHS